MEEQHITVKINNKGVLEPGPETWNLWRITGTHLQFV